MNIYTKLTAIIFLQICFAFSAFSQPQRRPIDTPAVYKIDGMDDIKAKREAYKTVEGEQLSFDLYQPKDLKPKEKRGVVVFANWKRKGMTEWVLMQSWGKIVAASGLNAVIYQSTVKPAEDINDVVNYLRQNAEKLQIDENRSGIFTMSGNTDIALPYFAQNNREFVRCAVIYYGFIIDNPPVRKDLPILIVRAGLEANPDTNKRLDGYVKLLIEQNAPLKFINCAEGHHAFDLVDDTDKSREIIKETLKFLSKNLR
jgi:hypothetical protein